MRVGIDGFSLSRNDSGIEVYTRELIKGLTVQHQLEVYTFADINIPVNYDNPKIVNAGWNNPGTLKKLRWELFELGNYISPLVDLFHCPHFILPVNCKSKLKVVTVHDLAFLRCPEFFDWKTKLYYRLFLKQSLAAADSIICISSSCANDVRHYFPEYSKKIQIIHNGFKDYSRILPDNSILNRLSISAPYVLMIGTLNPRKNLVNAIKAFERASSTGRDLELIIVGTLQRESLPVAASNPRIKFTGYLAEAELAALYKSAKVLLFPSFYEGFGFPVLEAMSMGLPVVTSNTSSLPEVSGYQKDLLCNPNSIDSIENLLKHFLSDSMQDSLKSHGYANVERFSWNKMVKETSQLYELL